MCALVTCFEPSVRVLINERHIRSPNPLADFLVVIFLANTRSFPLENPLAEKGKKKDRRPRLY